MTGAPLLEVRGLTHRYGDLAVLDGVDLQIAAGEVVSLVGPNGAGKSTLLKCLNGVIKHAAGEVLIDGRPTGRLGRQELARTLAYVPQQAGPAASLTVADMVAVGRAPHRGLCSAAKDRAVVLDCIEAMNLQSLALRLFGQLSGGQRQRVLIARAMAQKGRVMLLDEPTSDLDLRHQLETMQTLRALADAEEVAVLVAIHDFSLAARFSDRLVLMHQGRIHREGAWADVATPETLREVYGVDARIGSDGGQPYVIALSPAQ